VVDAQGDDFSGGHDLLAHAEITGKRRPWRAEESRKYVEYMTREWYRPIMEYPKPIICASHGRCFAGAVEFTLMCDMTVASEDASFSFNINRETGVQFGMMIPFLSGWKKAHEFYLTGATLTAREALDAGMVNRVVRRENLLPEAMRLGTIISRIPLEVVRLNKLAIRHTFDLMGMRDAQFYAQEASALSHLRTGSEGASTQRFSAGGIQSVTAERRNRFADVDVPFE
jgi:enoyl-CoA hydratase/carnithine racemase